MRNRSFNVLVLAIFLIAASACQKANSNLSAPSDLSFNDNNAKWVSCMFYGPKNEDHQHPDFGAKCGKIDSNGLIKFTTEFIAQEPHKLDGEWACTLVTLGDYPGEGDFLSWHYISQDGFGRGHNEHHDNGCAYPRDIENDVLKTYVGGKLAFFDKSMTILHQSDYVFGGYFHNKRATVCSEKPTKKWGYGFEHHTWVGGLCGELNETFEIVTPVERPYEYFHPIPEWIHDGFMLETKIIAQSGKGEELENILKSGTQNMAGNRHYRVYRSSSEPDSLLIFEDWEGRAAHQSSLSTPSVKKALEKGRPLILSIKRSREHEHYKRQPK